MKVLGLMMTLVVILIGFHLGGGNLKMLWQPIELTVIIGAGFGSFVFSNPAYIVKAFFTHFRLYFGGLHFNEKMYKEVLDLIQELSSIARQEGVLKIVHDFESRRPQVLRNYQYFRRDYDNQKFLVDTFLTFAETQKSDFFVSEIKIKNRIKGYSKTTKKLSDSLYKMGESMPAFGIVAAILGIILAMSVIDQSASVIGEAISAALVGTLMGVLFGYGLFIPMSMSIKSYAQDQEIFQNYVLQAVVMLYLEVKPMAMRENLLREIPHHVQTRMISNGFS